MQNWKIKRMSRKRINEWLYAVGILLNHYKGNMPLLGCPLCDIPRFFACKNCLWEILEHKECFDFKRELGIDGDICIVRDEKKWQSARIPMLRRWKKILQAEKDSRTETGGQ